FSEGVVSNAAPSAARYGTGTSIAFFGHDQPANRAVFLEHNRLLVADAFSGVLAREGDKENEPPNPLEGRPRSRVPVYDFALQRPVEDERRYYAVAVFPRTTQSLDPLRLNEVLAYDKQTGLRCWSTMDFQEGDDGYK